MALSKNRGRCDAERFEDSEYKNALEKNYGRGNGRRGTDKAPLDNKKYSHHYRDDGIEAHETAKNAQSTGRSQEHVSHNGLSLKKAGADREHGTNGDAITARHTFLLVDVHKTKY